MEKLLNLGCGKRFHKNWVNLDFVSNHPLVQSHNLLNGIPFETNMFEVVYHSHVLEHFSQEDGKKFIQECYRVLKPNGIIRIAVPNLEQIAKLYLEKLALAAQGNQQAECDYDWMMLELFDQTVRNRAGGAMAKYLFQETIPNEAFVLSRLGKEAQDIRDHYFKMKAQGPIKTIAKASTLRFFSTGYYKDKIKSKVTAKEREAIKIGNFRLCGEIHQWMYDRFSLKRLLVEQGFHRFEIKTAFDSNIPRWLSYELEAKDGNVYKPDSLFVEAVKL